MHHIIVDHHIYVNHGLFVRSIYEASLLLSRSILSTSLSRERRFALHIIVTIERRSTWYRLSRVSVNMYEVPYVVVFLFRSIRFLHCQHFRHR